MEFCDYIKKFPPNWRGVFAPLSKDQRPVLGADSWLLENHKGAVTLRSSKYSLRGNHINWREFVECLCLKEPMEVKGQLAFIPRILLFPANVQRNTLAFLSRHQSEIPVPFLEKLLDALRDCSVCDDWMKHYLRSLQDFVCQNRCQKYGSGFCANSLCSLSLGSRDAFEDVAQRIRDKDSTPGGGGGFQLQFDWLPEALSTNHHACEYSRCLAPAAENIESAGPSQTENLAPVSREEDSPEPSPMEVESATAENLPDELPVVHDSASGDVGGQSSEVDQEVLAGQRADAEDIGSQQEQARDDVVDADTMEKLMSLKVAMCKGSGSIPAEIVRVIKDIQIDKMEAVCDILKLDSTPVLGLAALAQELSGFSFELSHSSATILARRGFGQQIRDLTQSAPRNLITAAASFTKAFPKPTIEGALLPTLVGDGQVGGATTHQCDLIGKVLKEALTNESRVNLLRALLSIQTLQWSDELTGFFQTALACKLELDNHTLDEFITALEHHGNSRTSCAKFAKLLLAFVNRFSKQISAAGRATLQRLADANQTFLKNALLAAVKRVKG